MVFVYDRLSFLGLPPFSGGLTLLLVLGRLAVFSCRSQDALLKDVASLAREGRSFVMSWWSVGKIPAGSAYDGTPLQERLRRTTFHDLGGGELLSVFFFGWGNGRFLPFSRCLDAFIHPCLHACQCSLAPK